MPEAVGERPVEILLVEDNPADAYLTVTALRDARSPNEVHIVTDGEQALAFLKREGDYVNAMEPFGQEGIVINLIGVPSKFKYRRPHTRTDVAFLRRLELPPGIPRIR